MRKSFYLSSYLILSGLLCNFSIQAEEIEIKQAEENIKAQSTPAPVVIVGALEKVGVVGSDVVVHAKLAPSFNRSSIHAENVEEFKRKKATWVRFLLKDRYGNEVELERKLESKRKIKKSKSSRTERTVVLELCLADKVIPEEIRLVNRSKFEEELILGRSALAGNIWINPATSFTFDPVCNTKKKKPQKSKKESKPKAVEKKVNQDK